MDTPYGMMFNPETVETFEAEIVRIDRFVPMRGMTEGVELIINLAGEPTPVHLGPSWYLENQDLDIQEGDEVTITGSRLEAEGIPLIIATRIESAEGSLMLRDGMGFPVWSAESPMQSFMPEGQNMVAIQQFLFMPSIIEVAPGTTVTWINRDTTVHTVTSGVTGGDNTGDLFDSPELQPGQEFSHTFDETGVYPYFCRFHSNMTGRVNVAE